MKHCYFIAESFSSSSLPYSLTGCHDVNKDNARFVNHFNVKYEKAYTNRAEAVRATDEDLQFTCQHNNNKLAAYCTSVNEQMARAARYIHTEIEHSKENEESAALGLPVITDVFTTVYEARRDSGEIFYITRCYVIVKLSF